VYCCRFCHIIDTFRVEVDSNLGPMVQCMGLSLDFGAFPTEPLTLLGSSTFVMSTQYFVCGDIAKFPKQNAFLIKYSTWNSLIDAHWAQWQIWAFYTFNFKFLSLNTTFLFPAIFWEWGIWTSYLLIVYEGGSAFNEDNFNEKFPSTNENLSSL
jgi:hypothetical protein